MFLQVKVGHLLLFDLKIIINFFIERKKGLERLENNTKKDIVRGEETC